MNASRFVLAGVVGSVVGGAALAAMAQPVNDRCVTATALSDGQVVSFSTVGAGKDAGSCDGSNATGGDVWFRYTNTSLCAVTATFSTEGSAGLAGGIDPTLQLHAACGGPPIACNDDLGPGDPDAAIAWTVPGGATVWARVSQEGSPGNGVIRLTLDFDDADGDGIADCEDGCPGFPDIVNVRTGAVYATLSGALGAAASGDTLELGPCSFPASLQGLGPLTLTIRGRGAGATVLEGGGAWMFRMGAGGDYTFENLTMRNGAAIGGTDAGAVSMVLGRLALRGVHFESHAAGVGNTSAVRVRDGILEIEGCVFRRNLASNSVHVETTNTLARVFNTAFVENIGSAIVLRSNATPGGVSRLEATNLTFANNGGGQPLVANFGSPGAGFLYNSVSDVAVLQLAGFEVASNLFPGGSGANLDGVPSFVNAGAGDYRLASGSLGVEAGDIGLYAASGAGLFDAAGNGRFLDDPGTPNPVVGGLPLDLGAFELVGTLDVNPCTADLAMPFGVLTFADIAAFLAAFAAGCP